MLTLVFESVSAKVNSKISFFICNCLVTFLNTPTHFKIAVLNLLNRLLAISNFFQPLHKFLNSGFDGKVDRGGDKSMQNLDVLMLMILC